MRVELCESSYDSRVVSEFVALLERSTTQRAEELLCAVQQAAARLHASGVNLVAVQHSASLVFSCILV